ncbi:MAG TPA: glycosyltransferase family 2 protein [Gemmatimonadaceae bacterium]|nr:glycosyltransferase family 2 protein [Gemmatimonadaceae bacterium]
MIAAIPLLCALPWVGFPVVVALRTRRSRSLDEQPADVPAPAPLVSVVIPARNEARNIERCVRSVLGTTYPNVEVIVVNDHSTDGTGDIAQRIAQGDARLAVLENPDLPAGWFGKQWACRTGAERARGEILLFADADTWHAPDLLGRAVNAMRARGADLMSVAGWQELGTFWERVVQPQVFVMLAARYGGTESVSRARKAEDVIANGQCLFVRREAYDALGGHEAVRGKVAEDLALAQLFWRSGRRVALVLGLDQLGTRMYTSLGELVRGWQKNVFAGGRESVPLGALGRAVYPFVLIATPLAPLLPVLALLLSPLGVVSGAVTLWAAVCVAAGLAFWVGVYRFQRAPLWYALLYPLGCAVLLYIATTSVLRGRRVGWKGREYQAA